MTKTQIKILTIAFDKETQKFNDTPLQNFLAQNEVVDTQINYFYCDNNAYYSVAITYKQKATMIPKATISTTTEKQDEVQRTEIEQQLHETLREWRLQRSRKDNVPAYIFFNNEELKRIVDAKPTTIKAFNSVHGIGIVKTKKYGKDIIQLIKNIIHGKDKEKNR